MIRHFKPKTNLRKEMAFTVTYEFKTEGLIVTTTTSEDKVGVSLFFLRI